MTVNSEFQYVHDTASSSTDDELAKFWNVSSKRWCGVRRSQPMTREAVRERPGRVAVRDAAGELVGAEEAEPDGELEPEVAPAARQVSGARRLATAAVMARRDDRSPRHRDSNHLGGG